MAIVERPAILDVEVDAFGLLRREVNAARNDREITEQAGGRVACDRGAELVVDTPCIIIAQIDDRLRAERGDEAFHLDLVIVDREVEAGQEARFDDDAEREAFADLIFQGRITA